MTPLTWLLFLLPLTLAQWRNTLAQSYPAWQQLLEQHQTAAVQSAEYPEHYLRVPIDHFKNESRYEPHDNGTFNLRYWFDDQFYQPGGPVFVIAAGETDGDDRFPFLSQGIVRDLAQKYHGIGVILEHRYYGSSYPFEKLTTENIRFLTTEQAVADYAYFAQNVQFPGVKGHSLRPSATPWIAYGGSYAGAFVAFLRKLYPDTYWGAVSSSGVTQAIDDYWAYFEGLRNFGPPACIDVTQTATDVADRVMIDHAQNKTLNKQLKTTFGGSPDLTDDFFANLLSSPLGSFQSRNWDQEIGSPMFGQYCGNITSTELLYPDTEPVKKSMEELVAIAGYDPKNATLVTNLLNFAGYLGQSAFSALGPDTPVDGQRKLLAQGGDLPKSSGTSWGYQVCTEWGYFITGSGVPAEIRPLTSRVLDLAALSRYCVEDYGIHERPNVARINQHGGFDFSYPRVAIIDGLADPWRAATPHAAGARERQSTDSEPFVMIDVPEADVWDGMRGGVHHWDQNGLSGEGDIPEGVRKVQQDVVRFVGVWLGEWKGQMRENEL